MFMTVSIDAHAKTAAGEKSVSQQRELRSAHQERIREAEMLEVQSDLERQSIKKRNALWKNEQAKLTQEFRQRRGERLAQIDAEKAKETAARSRQKEIWAQMELEESEHKVRLAQRKMEILYGKESPNKDARGEETAGTEQAQKKPFWEKWLEPKDK
jgi:hypothetical protein